MHVSNATVSISDSCHSGVVYDVRQLSHCRAMTAVCCAKQTE